MGVLGGTDEQRPTEGLGVAVSARAQLSARELNAKCPQLAPGIWWRERRWSIATQTPAATAPETPAGSQAQATTLSNSFCTEFELLSWCVFVYSIYHF